MSRRYGSCRVGEVGRRNRDGYSEFKAEVMKWMREGGLLVRLWKHTSAKRYEALKNVMERK